MKLLFPIVIFLLVSACSQEPKTTSSGPPVEKKKEGVSFESVQNNEKKFFDFTYKDTVITKFPGEKKDAVERYYEATAGLEAEITVEKQPIAKNISLKEKEDTELVWGFDKDEVLQRFFGPELYHTSKSGGPKLALAWWTCSTCRSDTVSYMGGNYWGKLFPDKDINTTFINGDYGFKLKSKNYRLISFASYPGEGAVMFSGRFSGGIMGYALFEKEGDQAKLVAFNPSVGQYGTYNQPSDPDIRIAYDQLFLIYGCSNGGAGAPYTSSDDIFTFYEGKIQKVSHENFSDCDNAGFGRWNSTYQFFEENKSVGVKLVTSGYFIGTGENTVASYEYVFDGAPDVFLKQVEIADKEGLPFRFTLEKKIYFNPEKKAIWSFTSHDLEGAWVEEKSEE